MTKFLKKRHFIVKGWIIHSYTGAMNYMTCKGMRIRHKDEGLRCPCCRNRLRLRPRLGQARHKVMEIQRAIVKS